MKKILAIGNSFSEDATTYLYDMAACGGQEIKVVNLFIGGCSLRQHWENAVNDLPAYCYELNGKSTDRMISIKEALLEEPWDIITLQQASHFSGMPDSYYPFITDLSGYVKKYVPHAEQMIHQTWAYEIDSDHPAFTDYDLDQTKMYNALTRAYKKASSVLGVRIIPCGDVIQTLRGIPMFDYAHGGQSLCRDGFHMHLLYGRYAAAATWYEAILHQNINENSFLPPSVGNQADADMFCIIKKTVHTIVYGL